MAHSGNVDNTSDAMKPDSTATQSALNGKELVLNVASPFRAGLVDSMSNLSWELKIDPTADMNTNDVTITGNLNVGGSNVQQEIVNEFTSTDETAVVASPGT